MTPITISIIFSNIIGHIFIIKVLIFLTSFSLYPTKQFFIPLANKTYIKLPNKRSFSKFK